MTKNKFLKFPKKNKTRYVYLKCLCKNYTTLIVLWFYFLFFSCLPHGAHKKNRKFSFCVKKGTKRFLFSNFFFFSLLGVQVHAKMFSSLVWGLRGRIKEDPSVKDSAENKETNFLPAYHPRIKSIFSEYNNRNNWMYTNTFTLRKWSFEQIFTDVSLFFHIITQKGVERTVMTFSPAGKQRYYHLISCVNSSLSSPPWIIRESIFTHVNF